MDSIISSALDEICSQGPSGISLTSLWSRLETSLSFPLTLSVRASIHSNLLRIPTLHFKSPRDAAIDASDDSIQRLEDAERVGLRLVASSQLGDCFAGVYDVASGTSGLSAPQRSVLGRIALARENGITQTQLAKEFGIEGKNFFYIVKNLECKGLIVRQQAVVRTKETGGYEGELKTGSCISTNMIYLHRYAKNLNSQQKLEISRGATVEGFRKENENENDASEDGSPGEISSQDVLIKDYLPAMEVICKKLEEANGKVLVVSDLKRDLGYCGSTSRHRSWRNLRERLKGSGMVEEFDALVNEKVERCVRLLRKFCREEFERNCIGSWDKTENGQVKFGRRFPQMEQLVELPFEHQVYDMIDAEGSKGLTIMELCDRLGIENKKYHSRFCSMFSRFGMRLQAENHKRTVAFRIWTPENTNYRLSNAFLSKSKVGYGENENSHFESYNPDDVSHQSAKTFVHFEHSTSGGGIVAPGGKNYVKINIDISHMLPGPSDIQESIPVSSNVDLKDREKGTGSLPVHNSNGNNSTTDVGLEGTVLTAPEGEIGAENITAEANSCQSKKKHTTIVKIGSNAHPPLTTDALRREQRILERLKDEKFILRNDLHKWLVSLENKGTTMDRKTVLRMIANLQQQGHCRCLDIRLPNLTNVVSEHITQVVLHPSIQSLTPDLLSEIHNKVRSFEMQSRGKGSSRWKTDDVVPVLDGVQRTQSRVESDEKINYSAAIRANGFVLAKMVRTKLLHKFLWNYLNSSPASDDATSSDDLLPDFKSNSSSYKLFSLETVMKNMPLEVFSQVAGTTHRIDDMAEKCKKGLCLSDLPISEYRCLMDTLATGRLSTIIDILRRLKLIRLVADGHSDNVTNMSHANVTHALELKPYIEEPPSLSATSSFLSVDLRPRIRHDFTLLSEEAVEEYWKTLEYCYAVADRSAALHAFPGSAVHEVFVFRSWASVRVMTADQRAQLVKRIVKDSVRDKLPFKECEKIAKDLNLTLEQVLRVYYDKKRQNLKRSQSASVAGREDPQLMRNEVSPLSQKRKTITEERSVKRTRVDTVIGRLVGQRIATSHDTANKIIEEPNPRVSHPGEDNSHSHEFEGDQPDTIEEQGPIEEDDERTALLNKCGFPSLKQSRQKRFMWTDEADRQLVIRYVQIRVALGAKFHRVEWPSVTNLPAPHKACARRMATLKRNTKFRKALMKLCNVLSERYVKHLERTQSNGECLSSEGLHQNITMGIPNAQASSFEEKQWDDFDDENIKRALEGVLQLKHMAKLEASGRVRSEQAKSLKESGGSSLCSHEDISAGQHNSQITKCQHHWHSDIKQSNEDTSFSRQVVKSLAVSSAIELFKLIFLSTSKAPEVQILLSENLRRYSEHDLFAAFSYLRERKFIIGGNGTPFVLSQQFLHGISKSPFPIDTGKRAAKFSDWLCQKKNDLIGQGINLNADLQCGDILQLFHLVSSGELSIALSLPDEGVGEAEDFRNLKRKNEGNDLCDNKSKKVKKYLTEGELISRRAKGFPGIVVSIHRARLSSADVVENIKDGETSNAENCRNVQLTPTSGERNSGCSNESADMNEALDVGTVLPVAGSSSESPWDAMTAYAEHMFPDKKEIGFVSPQVFKTIYIAIQNAGDQGLTVKQVSHVVDAQGEDISECIIDVLHAFGRAFKVNAYESVRVVDALYRSKFSLSSISGIQKDPNKSTLTEALSRSYGSSLHEPGNHDIGGRNTQESITKTNNVHKVTILNLPEVSPSNEDSTCNAHEDGVKSNQGGNSKAESYKSSSTDLYMPILPWINGDGTVNSVVYNGLLRRVLGIVMQNPGILQEDVIYQMDVLNPQSSQKLIELMILDRHLTVRKMYENTYSGPPAILQGLLGSRFKNSQNGYRDHLFANPKSMSLL